VATRPDGCRAQNFDAECHAGKRSDFATTQQYVLMITTCSRTWVVRYVKKTKNLEFLVFFFWGGGKVFFVIL